MGDLPVPREYLERYLEWMERVRSGERYFLCERYCSEKYVEGSEEWEECMVGCID